MPGTCPASSPLLPQMRDERCAAAGFAAFITKPFRLEDVERVLALVAADGPHAPAATTAGPADAAPGRLNRTSAGALDAGAGI